MLMIYNTLQVLFVIIIFFAVKCLSWNITDKWGLPQWLQYRPWECYKCLSFWSLAAIYLFCGLILHLWITMSVGMILTILDTIAYTYEIKRKTIII